MRQSRLVSTCGLAAALSVVIMLIGGVLGVGMYISPMIAGVCLIPIGQNFGRKYHALLWLAVSILCFILVPDPEANLMYFALFGIYPLLCPLFQRLRPALRLVCKLAFFNAVIIAVETLVMLVLVPESMSLWMTLVLLVLGNITFLLYDFILPRAAMLVRCYFQRLQRMR